MSKDGNGHVPRLFLSYSHKNEEWRDRFLDGLRPHVATGGLDVWHDGHITHGEDWLDRIGAEIRRSRFAVLLLTPEFLSSDFIRREELPYIESLWADSARSDQSLTVFPWVCESCDWQQISLFSEQGSRIQCRPVQGALASYPTSEVEAMLTDWAATLTAPEAALPGRARTQLLLEDARDAFERGKASLASEDFRGACASFEEAERLVPDFADAHYFHALALLGGRRAKKVNRQTIGRVEQRLKAAIDARGSFLDYFMLGLFKWDYYQENKLRVPPPSTEQLLRVADSEAIRATFSQDLFEETFRYTPWFDSPVTRWLNTEG
jgi:hypothetical protein